MIFLYLTTAYLIAGLIFSLVFVTRLISRVDGSAAGSSWIFRILILPGCIALWPVLLRMYLKRRSAAA